MMMFFGTGGMGIIMGLTVAPGGNMTMILTLMGVINIGLGAFFTFTFTRKEPDKRKKKRKQD